MVEQVPRVRVVKKTVEDPQFEITDKVIDVPVVSVVQVSDVATDACLTCDAKCKVACETCVKDNMFTVTGEITVAGKTNHETIVRGVNKQSTNIANSVHVDKDDLDDDAHLRHVRDETENAEFLTGSMATRLHVPVVTRRTAAAAQHRSTQQHNNHRKQWQQAMQTREREKGRKDEGDRGQEGKRNEKEGEAEVKKDVTGWTVVTRNRRQRKMIQIFVKVNGSKSTPIEVNLTDDRVEDVMRRIQNDEDAYVTLHGRVLKRSEKLKSCEVTDGCTMRRKT